MAGSELRTKAMRWQVLPALHPNCGHPHWLFNRDELRLAEWLAGGQATVLKEGPHRAVYRVLLPQLDFIVKWYPGKAGTLRRLASATEARRECAHALALAGRDVPTVEPLAIGEARAGSSCLLLRTLEGVQPLGQFLEWQLSKVDVERGGILRRRLAQRLGRFLAQLHDAGVTHRDLHPDNLLLSLDGGQPRLYLADVHAVRLGRPLAWRDSRANLAVLNRWFMLRASRSDRLRFWHAYRGARQTAGWADGVGGDKQASVAPQPRGVDPLTALAVRELERHALASNLRFWRAQDQRCLEDNRYYRRLSSAVAAGHVVADLEPEMLASFLEDPDAAFQQPNAIILKDSSSSTVAELEFVINGRPRRLIYKRFLVTSWTDPFVALIRRTPALRSYVLGHSLRLRGLPTPRPLGVWHRYRAGLPHEGYLLTEKVPGARDLSAFLARLADLPIGERPIVLRSVIDRVARLISELHHRRMSHRDLKAANILMSHASWSLAKSEQERRHGTAPGAGEDHAGPATLLQAQPWFIDLVGVSRPPKLTRARRVQNLVRLNVSFVGHPVLTRTDRLRFLRVYLKWGLRGRFGWKRWWCQIDQRTKAKIEQNLRNRRPLG